MMLELPVVEAKMSVSDTAVPMAATRSHSCMPAGRDWVTIDSENTSTPAQPGSSFGQVNGEFTLPTHCWKIGDNNVHVDLNWNTELQDTATSN